MPLRTRAFAPGSIGNVGPGLDVLGLAIAGRGDTVAAERRTEPGLVVEEPGHPDLSADPRKHASALAASAVLRRAGLDGSGVVLRVTKGLPLSAGQGGSAASAVAGAGAVNALFGYPLDSPALLAAALEAEGAVAGHHADNVAPSLLGGLILVRSMDPLDVVRLPIVADLVFVLVHPAVTMRTMDARAVLPATVSRELALHQAAQVGAIVAAAASGDAALFGRAIDDRLAEPVRAPLLPGFIGAKRAALAAGALGCSISGSGPTAFAIAPDMTQAGRIAEAMIDAYRSAGLESTARIATPDLKGLQVTTS
jgi:homoserine kinase